MSANSDIDEVCSSDGTADHGFLTLSLINYDIPGWVFKRD